MEFYSDADEELKKLFPLHCDLVKTTGPEDGVILKFKTFYLKIYDDRGQYQIYGYRYNEELPVISDNVSYLKIREYASRFTKEDGLCSQMTL